MPYKVLADEVNILKKVGEFRSPEGNLIGYDHDSVLYFKDDIVEDENISPVVLERYEAGDAHTRSMIVRVDKRGRPVDTLPTSSTEEEEIPVLISKDKEAQGVVSTKEVPGPHSPKRKTSKSE